MPVTVIPAEHQLKCHPESTSAGTMEDFLAWSAIDGYCRSSSLVLGSSFSTASSNRGKPLYPSCSSFVRSAIEAWGNHSHLALRPDDVWFTILVQVNVYMSKHAEKVRHIFVNSAGTKEISTEYGEPWDEIIATFKRKVQLSIKTPWMSDWISPGFSTSTQTDETTATVLMMGMMGTYLSYTSDITCGIPSITLLGSKSDWQRLLSKIDRLPDFGKQPAEYARRLDPILKRIVHTFDDPSSPRTRDFWNQIVHAKIKHENCCGHPPIQYIVSGWILGFFFWSREEPVQKVLQQGKPYLRYGQEGLLDIDGVKFGQLPLEKLPVGYAKVDFSIPEQREDSKDDKLKCCILAGNVGKRIWHGAPVGYEEAIAALTGYTPKNKTQCSFIKGLFRGITRLSCFHDEDAAIASARAAEVQVKKMASASDDSDSEEGHSTIQPASGWVMIGPTVEQDIMDGEAGEETWGATVDAIERCDGVVHFQYPPTDISY